MYFVGKCIFLLLTSTYDMPSKIYLLHYYISILDYQYIMIPSQMKWVVYASNLDLSFYMHA